MGIRIFLPDNCMEHFVARIGWHFGSDMISEQPYPYLHNSSSFKWHSLPHIIFRPFKTIFFQMCQFSSIKSNDQH